MEDMKMGNISTRRRFFRTMVSGVAGARSAAAQPTSPAGTIRVQGWKATFEVDYGRLLESVAYTFIQTYGWRITFEEAPLVYAGDMVDMTKNFSSKRRSYDPRGGHLEFSYELGPGGRAPAEPAAVLRTAIEAYHRGGFPGRYKLLTVGEYLHIVPTATRNESGAWEAVQSPLDAVVSVDGGGRFPSSILADLVQAVQRASRYRILIGFEPFSNGIQPRIEGRFERTKAREILRSLIQATRKPRIWYLMSDPGRRRYGLSIQ